MKEIKKSILWFGGQVAGVSSTTGWRVRGCSVFFATDQPARHFAAARGEARLTVAALEDWIERGRVARREGTFAAAAKGTLKIHKVGF